MERGSKEGRNEPTWLPSLPMKGADACARCACLVMLSLTPLSLVCTVLRFHHASKTSFGLGCCCTGQRPLPASTRSWKTTSCQKKTMIPQQKRLVIHHTWKLNASSREFFVATGFRAALRVFLAVKCKMQTLVSDKNGSSVCAGLRTEWTLPVARCLPVAHLLQWDAPAPQLAETRRKKEHNATKTLPFSLFCSPHTQREMRRVWGLNRAGMYGGRNIGSSNVRMGHAGETSIAQDPRRKECVAAGLNGIDRTGVFCPAVWFGRIQPSDIGERMMGPTADSFISTLHYATFPLLEKTRVLTRHHQRCSRLPRSLLSPLLPSCCSRPTASRLRTAQPQSSKTSRNSMPCSETPRNALA